MHATGQERVQQDEVWPGCIRMRPSSLLAPAYYLYCPPACLLSVLPPSLPATCTAPSLTAPACYLYCSSLEL